MIVVVVVVAVVNDNGLGGDDDDDSDSVCVCVCARKRERAIKKNHPFPHTTLCTAPCTNPSDRRQSNRCMLPGMSLRCCCLPRARSFPYIHV